jgi:glycosyltransferase involved in cell wall biosynthesis
MKPLTINALPCLAIVIPCYNEQAVLPETLNKLLPILNELINKNKITPDSFLYCVDDRSTDETWEIIHRAHCVNPTIKGLRLSKNVGHQNALLAGLLNIKKLVACAITIDADLQDDIHCIETMIDHYTAGSDIVYGIRQSRHTDTWFKRLTAVWFYKIMKQAGSELVSNHADFRLLSQRSIEQLSRFKERNLFLRGIVTLIGFRASSVYYDRTNRLHGKTKYSLRKMIALAWNGVIAFSHMPLHFILLSGIASFTFSIGMSVWVVFAKLFAHTVPGWSSLMIPLCFMGGIQLLSIGILGEYLAKIYLEVKRRPRFIKDTELY